MEEQDEFIKQMFSAEGLSNANEKYFVSEAMLKYGGGFVKDLGQLLVHADVFNTKKVKETWPEYWAEYLHKGLVDPKINDA